MAGPLIWEITVSAGHLDTMVDLVCDIDMTF